MGRTDDTYLRQLQARYRAASKKEKSRILEGFAKPTVYHRKHASAVLNWHHKQGRGWLARSLLRVMPDAPYLLCTTMLPPPMGWSMPLS